MLNESIVLSETPFIHEDFDPFSSRQFATRVLLLDPFLSCEARHMVLRVARVAAKNCALRLHSPGVRYLLQLEPPHEVSQASQRKAEIRN